VVVQEPEQSIEPISVGVEIQTESAQYQDRPVQTDIVIMTPQEERKVFLAQRVELPAQ
jgi:hypothetical protein